MEESIAACDSCELGCLRSVDPRHPIPAHKSTTDSARPRAPVGFLRSALQIVTHAATFAALTSSELRLC